MGKEYNPRWIDSKVYGTIQICNSGHTGGQATVCKVKGEGSFYALKVFKRNADTPDVQRQMGVEFRAKFDDPFFIQPISRCQISANREAILFPWIEGTTLDKYRRSKPLSNDDKLDLMIEISKALACLHAKGWKHNDLKDSNIMVVDSNTTPKIRIIDFALASESDQDLKFTGNHNLFGKEEWVAPELHRQGRSGGIKNASQKSDVWALGCLLLYIETGKNLWDFLDFPKEYSSENFIDYCKQQHNNGYPISDFTSVNSTIGDPLRQILMRCLNIKRDLRPTAQHLVAEISSLRGIP